MPSEDPGLAPVVKYIPNITPPAYQVPPGGPAGIAALALSQLPPAGSVPAGSSTAISDSTAAMIGANIGAIAVGGGTNLCRVYASGNNWLIG
jgi:hypothetical protein